MCVHLLSNTKQIIYHLQVLEKKGIQVVKLLAFYIYTLSS